MGDEDATHLGSMVSVTVQVVVTRVHAELPLAGTDGRGPRAVSGEGRGHREGLQPGLPSESSFTCAETEASQRGHQAGQMSPPHDCWGKVTGNVMGCPGVLRTGPGPR